MRRSGTAWPWLLLLFGSACGDRVVVASEVSLVSAAESSDAGLGDARADDEQRSDAGRAGAPSHHPPANPGSTHPADAPHGAGGSSSTDDPKRH